MKSWERTDLPCAYTGTPFTLSLPGLGLPGSLPSTGTISPIAGAAGPLGGLYLGGTVSAARTGRDVAGNGDSRFPVRCRYPCTTAVSAFARDAGVEPNLGRWPELKRALLVRAAWLVFRFAYPGRMRCPTQRQRFTVRSIAEFGVPRLARRLRWTSRFVSSCWRMRRRSGIAGRSDARTGPSMR